MTYSITPKQLEKWCNDFLSVPAFKDYCPNGLQVDGGVPIHTIITGVTACDELIEKAISHKAQAILVHHGYFWKGEPAILTGYKGNRIRKLMQHGISLLAYHLPLDAHPTIGNNAQLANALGFTITEALYPEEKHPIGNIATCPTQTPETLIERITQTLQRRPLHLSGGKTHIKKIALCTGAAQDMIEQAALMGCDAFISGEVSERTTHLAKELAIDYFACGHHATERLGILTLGKYIAQNLNLSVKFIDVYNPV